MPKEVHHTMSMKKFLKLSFIPETLRNHHLGRNKVNPNDKVGEYPLAVVKKLRKDIAEALVTAPGKGMDAKQSYLAETKPHIDGLIKEKSARGEIELTPEGPEEPEATSVYEGEEETQPPVYVKDEEAQPLPEEAKPKLPPPPPGFMPISAITENLSRLVDVIHASALNSQRARVVSELGQIVRKYERRGKHIDLDLFTNELLSSRLNRYFPAIDMHSERTFFPEEPPFGVPEGENYQLKLREALREHFKEYLTT
ncbi:MAG: hypothetical protein KAW41_05730 [Candidatus Diapherotrites archaeon]|nr:hypothetical protein [Candidatus Diapherotrites archaeon]